MGNQLDLRASAPAVLAGLFAAIATVYGGALLAEFDIHADAYFVAFAFMLVAVVFSLIAAAVRASRKWTTAWRAASIGFAVLFVAISLPLWVMVIVTPGCECPDPVPLLGSLRIKQAILAASLAATPISLLALGLIRGPREPVQTPAEPEASNGATPAQPGSSD